ncbi:hypothetical protein BT93_L2389 [Corymbia citriodora subsp. variegata]|uniref:Uncharacterized protein n=1 Tax=Corymbia citriodora subsp. variegata TaxID=360336 RepID=A0A8T0CMG9_CORYI|nr:hypothetical protein BT93_L2389 [Corymbia citriodora subsp. variegata]
MDLRGRNVVVVLFLCVKFDLLFVEYLCQVGESIGHLDLSVSSCSSAQFKVVIDDQK